MIKNKIEYIAFLFFIQITRLFGINRLKYFAKIVAAIFFNVLKIRRKVVLNNLKAAFPVLSDRQIYDLAYKNYYSFAITLLEMMLVPYISRQVLHERIECVNLNLVREKFNEGNGVVLLTAHFGNWELGGASVSSQLGIPFHVLAKPQRNSYMTKWLKMSRERFGSKEILLGMSVRDLYSAIKEKNIVGVVGDQRGPKDGPRVKFFEQMTATFGGVASIALKTNTPVLMSMIVRQPDGIYKAYFEEISFTEINGTDEEKIIAFNQKYMNILEKYVREYPEQWFWMHKIWKY
ncbi:lysophospholipid acyltransferase family protein [Bacteroidota bacterium]